MERIHNVNLQPLASVKSWDTKRVKSYKDRIQKHISHLETRGFYDQVPFDKVEEARKENEIILQRFKNYKDELKKILENREHII